jgi:hypothetical protein
MQEADTLQFCILKSNAVFTSKESSGSVKLAIANEAQTGTLFCHCPET